MRTMNWEPEWHPQKRFLTKAVNQNYKSYRMGESYEDMDPPRQCLLQQTHLELNYSSVDTAENLEKKRRCRTTCLIKIKPPGHMTPMSAGRFNHREENLLTSLALNECTEKLHRKIQRPHRRIARSRAYQRTINII